MGSGFSPLPISIVKPGRPKLSMNQSLKPPCDAIPVGEATEYPQAEANS